MKKGFTLIELLIVVVVIIALMAVSFRVGSSTEDSRRLSDTINRMQRLENCLSGYYAAYGSYPPVPLHGSRDYTYEVNNGIQQTDRDVHKNLDSSDEKGSWTRVEAACRSQPVAFEYPCPYEDKYMRQYIQLKRKQNPSSTDFNYDPLDTQFGVPGNKDAEWNDLPMYKYGLMSFLLPRLLVMMSFSNVDKTGFGSFLEASQWKINNELPFDFESGQQYSGWGAVLGMFADSSGNERWKMEALPSQAVCARWLPNLEKTVTGSSRSFYGVDVGCGYGGNYKSVPYSSDSQQGGSGSQMFVPRIMTVNDGWEKEFYYYSPSPHQSYTLWSSGKDGKTFPPWVPDEEIEQMSAKDREMVRKWLADDVVHMKN